MHCKDCLIEALVGEVKPGGTGVIQVRQCPGDKCSTRDCQREYCSPGVSTEAVLPREPARSMLPPFNFWLGTSQPGTNPFLVSITLGDLCPERSERREAVVVNEEGCPGNVRPECYACGYSEC